MPTITNPIKKIILYVYYKYCNIRFCMSSWLRHKTGYTRRYNDLKVLKGKYEGKRCFVIATGPSLKLDDVLMLKDEFTFGMNNICLLYDKTSWRPSILGIQDTSVYERLESRLQDSSDNVWVSSFLADRYPSARQFKQYPINHAYMLYNYLCTDKLSVKFSDNAFKVVYDAYSITFSLMQIAVYMGFKEIYLLGCDCNQAVGKQNHFMENGHVEDSQKLAGSADRNIFSHCEIKKFCDARGVKVYNATRGGCLEVYPRIQLEEVLKP